VIRLSTDRKPSDIIADFISLIETSHTEYQNSMNIAKGYDKKTIDWIHEFELADNYDERNRLATALHAERKERRKHKDVAALYEKIHVFAISEKNKPTLKQLKFLLSEQKKSEEYVANPNREYKHRAGDDE
jgi:predicted ribonuclease YlaK